MTEVLQWLAEISPAAKVLFLGCCAVSWVAWKMYLRGEKLHEDGKEDLKVLVTLAGKMQTSQEELSTLVRELK